MKSRDALAVLETAYQLDHQGSEWLEKTAERLTRALDGAVASFAYTLQVTPEGRPIFYEAHHSQFDDPMGMLRTIHQNLSPDQVKAFFQPGTPLGAYSDLAAERLDDHPVTRAVYEQAAEFGAQDLVAIGSIDAKWRGVLVGVYLKGRGIKDSTRQAQERIGVHLHSAMRLRQTLSQQSPFDAAEAVFEADGTLAHAEGDATSLRDMLEAKVREVDRSRARQERTGSGDALDVWQGLVEGRWSLIDRVDTDDRRYYVAVVNPTLGVPSRALTAIEAQIAAMAVAGEPNKVIGYALGLPDSTVAGRLSSAMKKMGVRNRIDLIRVGRRLLDERAESTPASPEPPSPS